MINVKEKINDIKSELEKKIEPLRNQITDSVGILRGLVFQAIQDDCFPPFAHFIWDELVEQARTDSMTAEAFKTRFSREPMCDGELAGNKVYGCTRFKTLGCEPVGQQRRESLSGKQNPRPLFNQDDREIFPCRPGEFEGTVIQTEPSDGDNCHQTVTIPKG
jgi:hypothetical protein